MVAGVGLGFRRDLRRELLNPPPGFVPHFIEFAPENWMGVGGFWGKQVRAAVERYPVLCHGLSLSLGSPEPLDWEFIGRLKPFLDDVRAEIFSEHLSYSKCGNAHLYDLLPVPFTEEAVVHVADRIRQVQDFLGRRIAIENVSYYTPVAPEMNEATFLCRVVEQADCDLLLDVNNVYVNAFNHKYDAHVFLQQLPLDRVVYIHMAGHEDRFDDIKIDTHGEPICEDVYDLFAWTVERLQPVPVLLERDNGIPEYCELQGEMTRLQEICDNAWSSHAC
jgi:uncharacterized protein